MNVSSIAGGGVLSELAIWKRWRARRWPPIIPVFIVGTFVFCAVFAGLLSPHSPYDGTPAMRLLPPVWMEGGSYAHLLGTDRLGRDTLSRLLHGAQISLLVSIVGMAVVGTVGCVAGLVAGYFGGWLETILMRLADLTLSLPGILVAMLLAAAFRPSFTNVIIVVVLILWSRYARLVRAETLSIKQQDYVALARVAGCSHVKIMFRHILPNVLPSMLVLSTLQIGYIIVLEASLSFLGVGIPPPAPSWGRMVSDGRGLLEYAWWISILPGVAILMTVIALNNLGDWVRDRIDPKLRQV